MVSDPGVRVAGAVERRRGAAGPDPHAQRGIEVEAAPAQDPRVPARELGHRPSGFRSKPGGRPRLLAGVDPNDCGLSPCVLQGGSARAEVDRLDP
jgi:hypothetical protein